MDNFECFGVKFVKIYPEMTSQYFFLKKYGFGWLYSDFFVVFLSRGESVQVFLLFVYIHIDILEIQLSRDHEERVDCNPIIKFNPSTFLCLSQDRTWISNVICCGFLCLRWGERWLFVLWNCGPSQFKLSFHTPSHTRTLYTVHVCICLTSCKIVISKKIAQSSRWAPVPLPKTSKTSFGPVNFSVFI